MDVFERVREIQAQPIRLVRADPELFSGLSAGALADARSSVLVPRLRGEPGAWNLRRSDFAHVVGLLVIDGLLLHDVAVRSHPRSALVGPGDLIRPWDEEPDAASVPLAISWNIVEPATLAVLDHRFIQQVSRWPTVVSAVVERALRRSSSLTLQLALTDVRRVEQRLLLLFWHLADRWGRTSSEGVVIPVRLTHELLAQVIGAQRPTVTSGLQRLARAGLLHRAADRSWVLANDGVADEAPLLGPARMQRNAGAPAPVTMLRP